MTRRIEVRAIRSKEHKHTKPTPNPSYRPGQVFNPYKLFTGIFIPEGVVRYKSLSAGAKLAYGRFCRYAGEDGKIYPSIPTLASELGIGATQARKYVHELEDKRFIQIQWTKGGTSIYSFLWHPSLDGDLGESRKAPPLRKTGGAPLRKTAGPTPPENRRRRESSSRESGEESQGIPSARATAVKREAAILERAESQQPTPNPSFKADDDDKNRLNVVDVPKPRTNLEAREQFQKWLTRHHPQMAVANVLRVVGRKLGDTDGIWITFMDRVRTATTAPQKIRDGGHYTQIAKDVLNEVATKQLEAQIQVSSTPAIVEPKYQHICKDGKGCNSVGKLPNGEYCTCSIGQLAAQMGTKPTDEPGAAPRSIPGLWGFVPPHPVRIDQARMPTHPDQTWSRNRS